MNGLEVLGILGGAMFAWACAQTAYQTWKVGKDTGTPLSTMWLLFLACALYGVYLFASFGLHLPFVFLAIEVVAWGICLWYHYFPRPRNGRLHVGLLGKYTWIEKAATPVYDKDPSEGGTLIGYRDSNNIDHFFGEP